MKKRTKKTKIKHNTANLIFSLIDKKKEASLHLKSLNYFRFVIQMNREIERNKLINVEETTIFKLRHENARFVCLVYKVVHFGNLVLFYFYFLF